MTDICRFKFSCELDDETVETQLALAIISAECTFGQPKVRIGAAYCISSDERQVAIDTSSEVGEHIAQVFTGLLIRQLGEDGFTVERLVKRQGDNQANEL